uniref:CCHC-type domain-containing protein n=1 Tax=Scleropages formosus TaxID=113540 RepID=A0A8C9WQR9_SCLFO
MSLLTGIPLLTMSHGRTFGCHSQKHLNKQDPNCNGNLFYSNQPPFCQVCQGFGHTGAECTNMRCNNCLEKGHMARDCNGPHTCNICAAEDHLARNCSHRKYHSCHKVLLCSLERIGVILVHTYLYKRGNFGSSGPYCGGCYLYSTE